MLHYENVHLFLHKQNEQTFFQEKMVPLINPTAKHLLKMIEHACKMCSQYQYKLENKFGILNFVLKSGLMQTLKK